MSSRPINAAEADRLAKANLGDFTAPASEHVLGLDGIAAIVHPNNSTRSLSIAQLRQLFDGQITNWSGVGVPLGRVALMARDDKSGTYDIWKHLVMGDEALAADAQRFAESDKLSDAVASEPGAIGFIGLTYIRNARAIAVTDQDSPPLFPSRFTIASEDYPLSRRLFLYTPARPTSTSTLEFVNFALSAAGQKVVSDAGFVDLNIGIRDPEPCVGRCPQRYTSLSRKARRLSVDFRFRRGSTALDSRGQKDVERLLTFLRDRPNPHLFLLGFSDNQGEAAQNMELSRSRARQVDEELAAYGIRAQAVLPFGSDMPVASNTTEAGRDRNRRVEVWLGND
jgi:phosphate transport system substrate-binding protein